METIAQLRARLERQAGGECAATPAVMSVRTLVRRFMAWAPGHYAPRDGRNNEVRSLEYAVRPVLLIYGDLPAAHFGPVQLAAVQGWLCEQGSSRSTVLARVRKIRRIWRWAVGRGLLPPSILPGLAAVEPPGAEQAQRRPRVQAVTMEQVEATLAWLEGPRTGLLSNPLPSMIRVQLLTGMRPGEICAMEGRYVQQRAGTNGTPSPPVITWTYSPHSHKTAWRGAEHVIPLGPRVQDLIRLRLARSGSGALWRTRRGTTWTTGSYGTAVHRASLAAGVEPWRPNRLRHLYATLCAERAGRGTAGALLGHRDPRSTSVYCHEAEKYAEKWG